MLILFLFILWKFIQCILITFNVHSFCYLLHYPYQPPYTPNSCVFLFVCFSLTHQVQSVLPIYSLVWDHLWECRQPPWGHNLKETRVSHTHDSAVWSAISAMLKFLPCFILHSSCGWCHNRCQFPFASAHLTGVTCCFLTYKFFNSLFHDNTLVLLAKVVMQKFHLGLNTPKFLLIWTLTNSMNLVWGMLRDALTMVVQQCYQESVWNCAHRAE